MTDEPIVWNFNLLYKSDSDPQMQTDITASQTEVQTFSAKWQPRSDYLQDAQVLHEALIEYEHLMRSTSPWNKVNYYFGLKQSLDQDNPDLKAKEAKLGDQTKALWNSLHFFTLSLGKIDKKFWNAFLMSNELADYRHFLQDIFAWSDHLLSENEEKIMTLKSAPAHESWTQMTSTFLSKEIRHGKNLSKLSADFLNSSARVRDRAGADVVSIANKYVEVAENEFNAIMDNKKINDNLRHFDRPDAARHLGDDIDTRVVDSMTDAVVARFDIPHRYYGLKAKLLGVDKLKYWDRSVPYGKISKKYSYPQAVALVQETFSDLDPQFGEIFKKFVSEGQIDVFPKVGKRGGAYCSHGLMGDPVYIMLNHTDSLNDVLTLAHETGHGINFELMKSQNSLNFGSPLSIAEVASTFMEDFVLQKLLQSATPKQRLALYIQKLDDDVASIFRQTAAYNFEKELHAEFRKVGYLPHIKISEIFQKHMLSYMGPSVEQTDGTEKYWVQWPHFRNFFYVYSYASGLLISKALQNKVHADAKFILSVKQLLAAGSSDSPKNLFQKYANIDISDANFWSAGLTEVELLLDAAEKLFEEVKN